MERPPAVAAKKKLNGGGGRSYAPVLPEEGSMEQSPRNKYTSLFCDVGPTAVLTANKRGMTISNQLVIRAVVVGVVMTAVLLLATIALLDSDRRHAANSLYYNTSSGIKIGVWGEWNASSCDVQKLNVSGQIQSAVICDQMDERHLPLLGCPEFRQRINAMRGITVVIVVVGSAMVLGFMYKIVAWLEKKEGDLGLRNAGDTAKAPPPFANSTHTLYAYLLCSFILLTGFVLFVSIGESTYYAKLCSHPSLEHQQMIKSSVLKWAGGCAGACVLQVVLAVLLIVERRIMASKRRARPSYGEADAEMLSSADV